MSVEYYPVMGTVISLSNSTRSPDMCQYAGLTMIDISVINIFSRNDSAQITIIIVIYRLYIQK
jgi:hypothetical protein